jgi:hypothetical protein
MELSPVAMSKAKMRLASSSCPMKTSWSSVVYPIPCIRWMKVRSKNLITSFRTITSARVSRF